MNEIEQEIERLEAEAKAIRMIDEPEYIRIMRDVDAKREELAKIQTRAAIETEVNDAPFILEVHGQPINFRDWIQKDEDYRVIAIAVKTKLSEMDYTHRVGLELKDTMFENERQQYRDQIKAADEAADAKYNELSDRHEEQSFEIAKLRAEVALLRTQNHDLKNERDDFERRFQAATSEIESLKTQLAAQSTPQAPIVTNIDGDLSAAIKAAQAAKPAIYDVVKDQAEINYTAKLLDTDEVIEGKVVYIGKYRIATEAEVSRFRQEREEARNIPVVEPAETEEPIQVAPPELQFPTQDEPTVPEHVLDGEMASQSETVTRAEFQALVKRVAEIEDRLSPVENKSEAA